MTASPAPPPITSGKSLFSRHYLATHLPRHPEWAEDPGPVFACLAATDRLIDRAVYRLHGLGQNQITIVQGHHASHP